MQPSKSIPTKADWHWGTTNCPCDYLDEDYALKSFFGKSIEDALPYFSNSVLMAKEDLSCLPPIPFQFYIFAFTRFLMSEDARSGDYPRNSEASDGASSFLRLVRDKLIEQQEFILPVMDELMPVIEFVGTHQDLYDAEEEFYGSFSDLLKEIKSLYAANKS